jgi:Zn finger protein HypA/HybF involved in hydrogenase expression
MHDLHLADKILKQVLEFAVKNNLKKITAADIKIGDILEHGEFINSDNLKFNLGMLAQDTPAEDAYFKVQKIAREGEYIIKEIEGE